MAARRLHPDGLSRGMLATRGLLISWACRVEPPGSRPGDSNVELLLPTAVSSPPLLATAFGVLAVIPVPLTRLGTEPLPPPPLERLAAHRTGSRRQPQPSHDRDDPFSRHARPP